MIEKRHEVMTDERLEMLADRFTAGQYQALLRISFGEYILDPERWDLEASVLERGGALQRLIPSAAPAPAWVGWRYLYRGPGGGFQSVTLSTHN